MTKVPESHCGIITLQSKRRRSAVRVHIAHESYLGKSHGIVVVTKSVMGLRESVQIELTWSCGLPITLDLLLVDTRCSIVTSSVWTDRTIEESASIGTGRFLCVSVYTFHPLSNCPIGWSLPR